MTTRQILSEYYEKVAEKKVGNKVVNVFKAKGMGDLPKTLIEEYADPDNICKNRPVYGIRYETGNPDYGEWDAQIVRVYHGSIVDVYVCAILVRPFSEEARRKYESIMGQVPAKRVCLLWDSREYDEVHGYEKKYTVVEGAKKRPNKRIRPTLGQMRALQAEKHDLEQRLDNACENCRDYVSKIQRLDAEVTELRNKYSHQLTAAKDLSDKVNELKRLNELLEEDLKDAKLEYCKNEEVIRQLSTVNTAVGKHCNHLSSEVSRLTKELDYLKSRGLIARIFDFQLTDIL